jgi:hypothetical protein
MATQIAFFASIAFGVVAWSLCAGLYAWPQLRTKARADALRPLLLLHSFRFVGLSFIVPGVVASDIPQAFARAAAYGDIATAVLALLALLALRSRLGVALAWAVNVWGTADLVNAFYLANATGLAPSQLGAAFYIPTFVVPLLFVTHFLMFRTLSRSADAALERPARA